MLQDARCFSAPVVFTPLPQALSPPGLNAGGRLVKSLHPAVNTTNYDLSSHPLLKSHGRILYARGYSLVANEIEHAERPTRKENVQDARHNHAIHHVF